MISYKVFLEKIQLLESQELPFVVFKYPHSDDVFLIHQNEDTLYTTTDFTEKGFVISSFSGDKTFLIKEENVIISKMEKENSIISENILSYQKTDKESHIQLVRKAISAINNKKLEKVVLSQRLIIPTNKKSLSLYFQRLICFYPSAFCYVFSHPKVGKWLAATPETLVKINKKKLETMSLAGTQLVKENEEPIWTPKEEEEQKIVTNVIVSTLQEITENLTIEERYNFRAGNLWHLCNRISAKIPNNVSVNQIIKTLHPTPAVCGFPTEKAYSFILKNECYPREFYTGFCGLLNFQNENKWDIFVNLRCMQLTDNELFIYVGGGINKDSNPESEWQELQNKAQTILKILV
ncbi:MAG: isochorismate synthase [Capnocytophaga sp.]|nr:isochorismate synthase [Capnocytophaga sp.]